TSKKPSWEERDSLIPPPNAQEMQPAVAPTKCGWASKEAPPAKSSWAAKELKPDAVEASAQIRPSRQDNTPRTPGARQKRSDNPAAHVYFPSATRARRLWSGQPLS